MVVIRSRSRGRVRPAGDPVDGWVGASHTEMLTLPVAGLGLQADTLLSLPTLTVTVTTPAPARIFLDGAEAGSTSLPRKSGWGEGWIASAGSVTLAARVASLGLPTGAGWHVVRAEGMDEVRFRIGDTTQRAEVVFDAGGHGTARITGRLGDDEARRLGYSTEEEVQADRMRLGGPSPAPAPGSTVPGQLMSPALGALAASLQYAIPMGSAASRLVLRPYEVTAGSVIVPPVGGRWRVVQRESDGALVAVRDGTAIVDIQGVPPLQGDSPYGISVTSEDGRVVVDVPRPHADGSPLPGSIVPDRTNVPGGTYIVRVSGAVPRALPTGDGPAPPAGARYWTTLAEQSIQVTEGSVTTLVYDPSSLRLAVRSAQATAVPVSTLSPARTAVVAVLADPWKIAGVAAGAVALASVAAILLKHRKGASARER
jgi:hypothetical protein